MAVIWGDSYKVVKFAKERNKYRLIVTSPPYFGHRNYGDASDEIGKEKSVEEYLNNLVNIFVECKKLLTDDGSLFIVIGDTRRNHQKLMIPHRLALKLVDNGYVFQEDIIWYKKNAVSTSSKRSLAQSYEVVLWLSKTDKPFVNLDPIRTKGNEVKAGTEKPKLRLLQYGPFDKDPEAIKKIEERVYGSDPELPTTAEISRAFGYDPEKHCPTCYRKFKRHAVRKRTGGHKHYPIFAACNPNGKNPGNVWEISTKAHHGNEHFAIFPEDLVSRIIEFTTEQDNYVLDPFCGRGTSGIAAARLGREFTGIDLYLDNVQKSEKNIEKEKEGLE